MLRDAHTMSIITIEPQLGLGLSCRYAVCPAASVTGTQKPKRPRPPAFPSFRYRSEEPMSKEDLFLQMHYFKHNIFLRKNSVPGSVSP